MEWTPYGDHGGDVLSVTSGPQGEVRWDRIARHLDEQKELILMWWNYDRFRGERYPRVRRTVLVGL